MNKPKSMRYELKTIIRNNKTKLIVILSTVVFIITTIIVLSAFSSTQNCVSEMVIEIPTRGTLLRDFSALGNLNAEDFQTKTDQLTKKSVSFKGSFTVSIDTDRPVLTAIDGHLNFTDVAKIGCFKQTNLGFEETLKMPVYEAFNASLQFQKPLKSLLGKFDLAQIEVFQGKVNFFSKLQDSSFELPNHFNISQKGFIRINPDISTLQGKIINADVKFPQDFTSDRFAVICGINPDYYIIGNDSNGSPTKSQVFSGISLHPFDYNYIAFYPKYETIVKIVTSEKYPLIMLGLKADDTTINFSNGEECQLRLAHCKGDINLYNTIFKQKFNTAISSDIEFNFKSVNSIQLDFKIKDEISHASFKIDGITTKVVYDGTVIGAFSFEGFFNMIFTNVIFTTIYSAIVTGYISALFIFIFERKKGK